MMRKLLVISGMVGILVCSALAYALVWGKLFPFSPVIVGFRREELPRVVLYTEENDPYAGFEYADSLIAGVEEFHELTFKAKPKLFFFGSVDTYARRSPSKARVCAFFNGAIVVSPWVQREDAEGTLSLRVYLTHELSHSILYQNMNVLAKLRYPRWLLEGVATYSADQMGTHLYPSREETYALIQKGNWMPPQYYDTDDEDRVRLDVENRKPFIYCEFACIVDDLVAQFGRDAFLSYLKRLLTDHDHDVVFGEVFGVGFDAYLTALRARIDSTSSRPELSGSH